MVRTAGKARRDCLNNDDCRRGWKAAMVIWLVKGVVGGFRVWIFQGASFRDDVSTAGSSSQNLQQIQELVIMKQISIIGAKSDCMICTSLLDVLAFYT